MVDFSSSKCFMMKYHSLKCLLNAKATDYPCLEWFARQLTAELKT